MIRAPTPRRHMDGGIGQCKPWRLRPSPCVGSGGDMEHVFYTKLLSDLAIYGIGLARRDRTLARLRATLDQRRTQPATYACTLVPGKAPGAKRAGCS